MINLISSKDEEILFSPNIAHIIGKLEDRITWEV